MTQFKIYDAFPAKAEAKKLADTLRKEGVQYVRVREIPGDGRLKWGVYLAGKNSRIYV